MLKNNVKEYNLSKNKQAQAKFLLDKLNLTSENNPGFFKSLVTATNVDALIQPFDDLLESGFSFQEHPALFTALIDAKSPHLLVQKFILLFKKDVNNAIPLDVFVKAMGDIEKAKRVEKVFRFFHTSGMSKIYGLTNATLGLTKIFILTKIYGLTNATLGLTKIFILNTYG